MVVTRAKKDLFDDSSSSSSSSTRGGGSGGGRSYNSAPSRPEYGASSARRDYTASSKSAPHGSATRSNFSGNGRGPHRQSSSSSQSSPSPSPSSWSAASNGSAPRGGEDAATTPSSRLIVKNLPKHITEQRLRTHFGTTGTAGATTTITDVKLMKTSSGIFRRFAFIGFASREDAARVKEYFGNSYLDTSKLEIDFAKEINDPSLPRPWSKYSTGSSSFAAVEEKKSIQQELVEKKERAERLKQLQLSKQKLAQEAVQTKSILSQLYTLDDDPKLQEFLDLVVPASKAAVWANDGGKNSSQAQQAPAPAPASASAKSQKGKGKRDGVSSAAAHDKLHVAKSIIAAVPAKRPGGDGVHYTKTHLVFGDDNNDDDDGEVAAGDSDDEYQDLDSTSTATKGGSNDASSATATATATATTTARNQPPQPQQHQSRVSTLRLKQHETVESTQEDDESLAESGRLFVRNLAFSCTEDNLIELFSAFGPLAEVHMPIDTATKKPKGIAFVLFLMPEHAVKAFEKLDGTTFQGRLLHLLPAKTQPVTDESDQSGSEALGASGSYKMRKQTKQKAASTSDFNWNSLFIGNNTVAEAISAKYGISKSELLDPEAGSMAVRMALAESQIISETKQFLQDQGIHLDGGPAAAQPSGVIISSKRQSLMSDRSRTILLVKNIPFSTQQQELYDLFAKYGALQRVALPPTKAIAVVEFQEPSEARSAFRHLAYAKFKHVPLYLEWAPQTTVVSAAATTSTSTSTSTGTGTSIGEAPSSSASSASTSTSTPMDTSSAEKAPKKAQAVFVSSASASNEQRTLFVKNLNFATTDDDLKAFFAPIGEVVSAYVAKKKDMQHSGQLLSMGYGFVEFATKQLALEALKKLQGQVLDAHALELKLSQRTSEASLAKKRTASEAESSDNTTKESTKLLVRNIPFEANRKELFEIFSPFGEIKNLRLPKKMGGQHRGFAFVEFITIQDAKKAFEALKANHFYGRHLVIEWAADEASIDAIREKTAAKFGTNTGPRKRTRLISGEPTGDAEEN